MVDGQHRFAVDRVSESTTLGTQTDSNRKTDTERHTETESKTDKERERVLGVPLQDRGREWHS